MGNTGMLYDQIGAGYNSTRQADPYITEKLFQFLSLQKDKTYLDIGCGTGNYTIALANKGFNFYGVEPAGEMLNVARERNRKINWLQGRAEHIPVGDNLFSGAMATLTIHHWVNIKLAFQEIYRVLADDGRLVIFTAEPEQMQGYWLNYYFPNMMENSIGQMPSLKTITAAANEAGFNISKTEKYFIKDDLQDHFLYAGKNRPNLYLNEKIRKGISSFSALANRDEVEAGLAKLAADVQSGKFAAVKNNYGNNLGDYLFVVAEKKKA